MILIGFVLLFACHGVESDSILGRDLAAADSRFAPVPDDLRLGYAPAPGLRRTLGAAELKRIAGRFDISGEFTNICFEYPMRDLTSQEILQSLLTGLNTERAEIEIAEFSRYPAPKGEVVFPRNMLSRPSPVRPGEPVLWRGYVKYAGDRHFTVWARVRIQVPEARVIALENLDAARPVRAEQLRVEVVNGFPSPQPLASSVEQVAGRMLRRAVRSGAAVSLDAVDAAAQDVNRGDKVEVRADSGQAHLTFEARAESSGAVGDAVKIRNAKSGKIFPARVVAKGKVAVVSE